MRVSMGSHWNSVHSEKNAEFLQNSLFKVQLNTDLGYSACSECSMELQKGKLDDTDRDS